MRPFVACCLAVMFTTMSAVKAENANVIEALSKNPKTKIFAEAIAKVGLSEELSKKPAVTVFALTDEGFSKLTNKEMLLADKNHLSAFLRTYIVEQNIDVSRVGKETEYTALDGHKLKVSPEKQINGVSVAQEEHTPQYSMYTLDTPLVTSTNLGSSPPWNGEWQSSLFDFSWLSPWTLPFNNNAAATPPLSKRSQDLKGQNVEASKISDSN